MAFNKLNVTIGAKLVGFEETIKKMERSLNKFSRNMQRIGSDLTQSVSLPLAGLGAASLRSFAQIEKLEKGLVAMMGSTEAAQAEMRKLREVAALPGLGFAEAIQGSVRLQAIEFSAEQARQTMLAFGQAIAVTGGGAEDLDAVTRQITQMVSKNRILQEDFQVLQDRVPLIGTALQNAFGTKNIEQIRESGISAKEFTTRLTEALGKLEQVKNAQGGLSLAFENFGDSLQIALAGLGKEINRIFDVQGALERLGNTIQNAVDWFISLDDETKRSIIRFGAFAAAIGPVVLIAGKLTSVLTLALTGVKTLLGPIKLLTAGFIGLFSPIGVVITVLTIVGTTLVAVYQRSENFRRSVNALINVIVELGKLAKESFAAMLEGFQNVKMGNFKAAIANFKEVLQKGNPIGVALTQGKRLSEAYQEGFSDDTNRLDGALENIKAKLRRATQDMSESVAGTMASAGIVSPGGATGGGGGGGAASPTRSAGVDVFAPLQNIPTPMQVQPLSDAVGVLGVSLADLGAKTEMVKVGMSSSMEQMSAWKEMVLGMGLAIDTLSGQAIPNLNSAVSAGLDTFGQLAQQGVTSFKQLAQAVIQAGAKIVETLIRQGVAAAIANTLRTSTKLLGPVGVAIAGAAGAAASGLFKSVLGKIGKFADGGIVPGTFSQATPVIAHGSEMILNPSQQGKLFNLINGGGRMGGGGVVEVVGILRGEDIYLATVKAARDRNRFGNSQLTVR